MTAKIENNQLIITLPLLDKPTPSTSGKSLVVAGTGGFTQTSATVQGKPVKVSVNAIIK